MKTLNIYKSFFRAAARSMDFFARNENVKNELELHGVINYLWQSWNHFWRYYWIYNYIGHTSPSGIKNQGNGLISSNQFNAIIYNILHITGNRKNALGQISGSYQEPTWGSKKSIIDIATALNSTSVIQYLGIYSQPIEHLQITRNGIIHIDKDNILRIKQNVIPYYQITSITKPTEILFANTLSQNQRAYKFWIDNLNGFLKNILF